MAGSAPPGISAICVGRRDETLATADCRARSGQFLVERDALLEFRRAQGRGFRRSFPACPSGVSRGQVRFEAQVGRFLRGERLLALRGRAPSWRSAACDRRLWRRRTRLPSVELGDPVERLSSLRRSSSCPGAWPARRRKPPDRIDTPPGPADVVRRRCSCRCRRFSYARR